jgi:hypothetical protein
MIAFDRLNKNSVFEISTYLCVVTANRTGFDQDVFISADDCIIKLVDVLRNREKTLYYEYTNLILDISVLKRCDRWPSLQHNINVYILVHNDSTQATIKHLKPLHSSVSRLLKLIQK